MIRRPSVPDVTLVAVTSVALLPTLRALQASIRQVDFARILFLSDQPPPTDDGAIEWRKIERLGSRADYSRFMLTALGDHIATSHALCVQWDGFVVKGDAWDQDFLSYDYIGAPWPHFHDSHNVGNGGFSLRSRRLLKACRKLPHSADQAEDVVIARIQRTNLESQGIRFAPEDVARRFSYERSRPTGAEFGFHGAFNLLQYLTRRDAGELFSSLEPGMLARNERWELFRWAVLRGRLGLATAMLKRLA